MRTPLREVAALTVVIATHGLVGCDGSADRDRSPEREGAPSATPMADFDSVLAAVEERMAVYDDLTTGVIALVRVGGRTEVVTDGRADVAARRPTRPSMTFPIASITKPMIATLVLQLVDEGMVRLDDPVSSWVPELDAVRPTITVQQLLSHRGGLREVSDADIDRVGFDTADLVAASARHPDFPSGAKGVYSNVGFGALGLLVERVLRQPLAEALADRIFAPAGMDASSLGGAPDVRGYFDGRPVEDYFLQLLPAAGSVVASAGDVDRFFRSLWAGELVPDGLVSEMRRSHGSVRIGERWRPDYGLGLIRYDVSCGTAIGHSGRIGGFTDEAWTLESEDRSTVLTVNDQNADSIARSIVETALCGGD